MVFEDFSKKTNWNSLINTFNPKINFFSKLYVYTPTMHFEGGGIRGSNMSLILKNMIVKNPCRVRCSGNYIP